MKILKICLSVLLLLGIAGCSKKVDVVKDDAGSFRTIVVSDFNGVVDITRSEGDKLSAYDGLGLYDGDDVNVASASDLTLDVDSDKHLYAEENTHFWLEAAGSEGHTKTRIHLESGSVLCRIEKTLNNDETFDVNTQTSIMSVRGTVFAVNVMQASDGSTYEIVEVFDGKVATKIEENQKEVTVLPGQAALIKEADENTPESFFVMADQIDQESWHSSERDVILISETSELNDPILDIPYEKMPSETVGQLVEMKKDGEDIYIEQEKLERIQETGHEYFEISRVEATCEQDGIRHLHCNLCGNDFDEIIPATGHSFVTVDAKEATCLESGLTEGSKCEKCGKWETPQTVIPALGHNGDPCSRCGETTKTPEKEEENKPTPTIKAFVADINESDMHFGYDATKDKVKVTVNCELQFNDSDKTETCVLNVLSGFNNDEEFIISDYNGTLTNVNDITNYFFANLASYTTEYDAIASFINDHKFRQDPYKTIIPESVTFDKDSNCMRITGTYRRLYHFDNLEGNPDSQFTMTEKEDATFEINKVNGSYERIPGESKEEQTIFYNYISSLGHGNDHFSLITYVNSPEKGNDGTEDYVYIKAAQVFITCQTCGDFLRSENITTPNGFRIYMKEDTPVILDNNDQSIRYNSVDTDGATGTNTYVINDDVLTSLKNIYYEVYSKPLTTTNFSTTPKEDDEEKSELEPINKENQLLNCFEELDGFYYGEIIGVETKNNLEATLAINYYENDELIGTPTITVYRNSATGDISLGKVDEDYMYHNELTTWLSENNKELIGKINEDFVAHTYECFGGLKINTFSLDDKTNSITTSALYGPYILYNRLNANYVASIGAVVEIQVKGTMIKDGLYTWELLETDKGVKELSSLDQDLLTRLSIEYLNSLGE